VGRQYSVGMGRHHAPHSCPAPSLAQPPGRIELTV
jgi:hypothetical protein